MRICRESPAANRHSVGASVTNVTWGVMAMDL
jgi:hypothetical protein